MATYKVIQDIEAEDKLLGPLTLRQFIYAIIVIISGVIMFRLMLVNWLLAMPLLPHTIFFALLALPFGHDQPSEVWMLAKIRFFLKPRKRIWDQSGIQELVTITAPKRIERMLTKGLSQKEVRSRLQALANTIDSRGWSVKNINVNLFGQPTYAVESSDRLIGPALLPQETDITVMDDMLDEQNNPTAQNLNRLMAASAQAHRQQAVNQMKKASQGISSTAGDNTTAPPDYWFLSQTPPPARPGLATLDTRVVAPGQTQVNSASPTPAEEALIKQLQEKQEHEKSAPAYGHMRTILPLSDQPVTPPPTAAANPAPAPKQTPPVTATPDPDILELANNDDLNVETLARQAKKNRKKKPPTDEVVVSLR